MAAAQQRADINGSGTEHIAIIGIDRSDGNVGTIDIHYVKTLHRAGYRDIPARVQDDPVEQAAADIWRDCARSGDVAISRELNVAAGDIATSLLPAAISRASK